MGCQRIFDNLGNVSITEGLSGMITNSFEEALLHSFNSVLRRVTVTALSTLEILSSNGYDGQENKENPAQHKLKMLKYYVQL